MMIFKDEAIRIARQLISDHFPELASRRIKYRFVAGKKHDYYMASRWGLRALYIDIEKEVRGYSKGAFRGCLAHELAHLVMDGRKAFFRRYWGHHNETAEERDADALVVERGLGSDLLQFQQEHERTYKSYKGSEGMTKREIKKILRRR